MKKLTITLILLLTFTYSFTIALLLAPAAKEIYGHMFYHRTYIQSINTPSYNDLTQLYLSGFNALAGGGIISYEKNDRPIFIEEQGVFLQMLYPEYLGMAISTTDSCVIYMKPGLDETTYGETLIHEYLHCFDYDHNDNPLDLMYYMNNPIDKVENIKYYAIELKRKYYEPRFYRF